jgi:hypothetical protein
VTEFVCIALFYSDKLEVSGWEYASRISIFIILYVFVSWTYGGFYSCTLSYVLLESNKIAEEQLLKIRAEKPEQKWSNVEKGEQSDGEAKKCGIEYWQKEAQKYTEELNASHEHSILSV